MHVKKVVGIVVGWTHDVQRVAVVVFRNLQNDQVEPHFLRIEYFGIKCGENVPHVGVVNHGFIARNELPEIFVCIDGVAHRCFNPFLCFCAFSPCARHHFLHVFALAVNGSYHFIVLAGSGFKCIHQRSVLIR